MTEADVNPQPDGTDAQSEPEPNTQLSDYGKLMRARFEVADKYAEDALPKAFAARFRNELREMLDRDWNHFGAVDSLIVNAKIPFVNDVLRWAYQRGLLSEDEIERTEPERVSA